MFFSKCFKKYVAKADFGIFNLLQLLKYLKQELTLVGSFNISLPSPHRVFLPKANVATGDHIRHFFLSSSRSLAVSCSLLSQKRNRQIKRAAPR